MSALSVPHPLASAALSSPDRVAIEADDGQRSFRQLREVVAEKAGWLLERGAKPGRVVALVGEPSLEWVEAFFAITWTGAIAAPIDPRAPRTAQDELIARLEAAALVASEDMAADLGAERSVTGEELAAVRERFLIECVAAGVVAIDCPFTFSSLAHAEADLLWARRRGFRAKSIVAGDQVALVNRLLTPAEEEVAAARRLVAAFEAARARGDERCEIDGHLDEVPTVNAARRLIARAEAFAALGD